MTSLNDIVPIVSTVTGFATVLFTTLWMARQTREIAHERNALALIEAIDGLSSPAMVEAFEHLRGVDERYPTKADFHSRFIGSEDERALFVVGQFIETVGCLARREVLDVTLIVDAVGLMIRNRWETIRPFIERYRRFENNPYVYENFEWLARYSNWWKDVPRPPHPNYDPAQFA
ncbi:MAG TPA: DUF4760 domain-containing protein [Candidatus Eremiobacteraceae bacterium]|nr:DUF4760 domain-containing protein [Candidatus Eremiobacteraceae bacterium]